MKRTIDTVLILIICFIRGNTFAQAYNGEFSGLFFGPQPSARAEAMGRSLASVPGDPTGYFYNPAGLSGVKGLNIDGGAAVKGTEAPNVMGCIVFGVRETFGAGLSYDQSIGVNNIRVTAASQIVKDLNAGVSVNIFNADKNRINGSIWNTIGGTVLYFDIGAMKRFRFDESGSHDEIVLGTSLVNLNSAGYESSDGNETEKLPVILRAGTSYSRMFWEYFKGIVSVEYEDVLNSKDYQSFHSGLEFGLDPLLFLRAGFFAQDVPGKKTHTAFTYGVGVNILLPGYFSGMERGMEPKFAFIFDYSRLNLPSFDPYTSGADKYDQYSLRFTYWY
ncbi:MAG: hypothetical protein K1X85_01305 [Ignavibacteria bacterium]|nr:hypothetical protein [Ignavibacteria bacterium]